MTRTALAVLSLLLAACLPSPKWVWVDVPLNQAQLEASSDYRLKPGDLVRVRTTKEKRLVFRVKSLYASGFNGVASDKKTYRVPYAGLVDMQVERMTYSVVDGRLGTF